MSSMIRPAAPPTEVEIPYDLAMPVHTDQPVAGLPAVAPGQLVELSDGQQVLILTLSTAAGTEPVARVLRVCWPRHNVLPLGEVFELQPSDPLTQGTLRVVCAQRCTSLRASAAGGHPTRLYHQPHLRRAMADDRYLAALGAGIRADRKVSV